MFEGRYLTGMDVLLTCGVCGLVEAVEASGWGGAPGCPRCGSRAVEAVELGWRSHLNFVLPLIVDVRVQADGVVVVGGYRCVCGGACVPWAA